MQFVSELPEINNSPTFHIRSLVPNSYKSTLMRTLDSKYERAHEHTG